MQPLKQLFQNIVYSGVNGRIDSEAERKIILLNIVLMTGLAALAPMGWLALLQDNIVLGVLDWIIGGILFLNYLYLRKTGRYVLVSYLGIASCMILFSYLILTGGVNNSAFVWYYTFPLFALFLLGTLKGMIASLLLFIPALIVFVADLDWPFLTTYSIDLRLRFVPSYLVVVAYSVLFEAMRARIHAKLLAQNKELEQTRMALEDSRQHLEDRVQQRTAELIRLNDELYLEVKQRQKAQAALTIANESFDTVLNSIDATIYVADLKTYEILFMNDAMKRRFYGNYVGQLCYKALRKKERPCTHCNNHQLIDANGHPSGVHVWEEQNPLTGEWYINYDRAIRWTDGRYVKLQVASDVTKRKRAEESLKRMNEELEFKINERTFELIRANRDLKREIQVRKGAEKEAQLAKAHAESASHAKSAFLANMSHELRTPLNHIIGFSEMISNQTFGSINQKQKEYLDYVLTSSHHLLSLVNDILDIAKIEAGKLELEVDDVRLKPLLENSLTIVKEKAMKNGVQLDLQVDGIPDIIKADPRKLKQIIYNLLSNAMKFTPQGGKIELNARMATNGGVQPDSAVQFSVADTGIGIASNNLKRIFEPFEQVEHSYSRFFQGTGLGLSLTRKLVSLHGGKIWVESEGESQGSCFHFTIPVEEEALKPHLADQLEN